MIINKAISYIAGRLTVEVRGGFIPQFMDEAMQKGLDIYNIRYSDGVLLFESKPRIYRSLRTAAKANQCRMKILKKHGLVFAAKRNKHTAPIALAVGIYFISLWILGLFVINISISGNYKTDMHEIRNILGEHGVSFLSPRSSLDIPSVENGLMSQNSDISWVSLNLSYASASLEISEKKLPPLSEYSSEYKTAVSSDDAVITAIELKSGNATVSVGDVVRQGQAVAIAGESMSDHSWVSGVNGEIKGLVDFEVSKTYKAFSSVRSFTGRQRTLYVPSDWSIDLVKVADYLDYIYYDVIIKEIPLSIFNVSIPLTIKAVTIREISQQDIVLSEKEMLADFMICLDREEALIKGDVLARSIASESDGNNYRFISRYTVQKNIMSLG